MEILAVPSPLIDAALSVLADGKARTADDILEEARTRKLLDETVTRKRLYTALSEYIHRSLGVGRKPEITEDIEHRFRINRAPDDWPDVDTTGLLPLQTVPALSKEASAAVQRARNAAAGADPTEYELAVCELFTYLGFASTHVGGTGAPDGYADALLGPLAYRVLLECKLAQSNVIAHIDSPVEAAKYRDSYHGDYCLLIAPAFAAEASFVAELRTHGVCACTTDDLIGLIERGVRAAHLRALFATPGIASDAIDDYYWQSVHGQAKRLRVIASIVLVQAAAQQRMAEHVGGRENAPHFTVDVAMSVVDAQLVSSGSATACKREEVLAVFDWLTNPLVRRAIWADDQHTSIVII